MTPLPYLLHGATLALAWLLLFNIARDDPHHRSRVAADEPRDDRFAHVLARPASVARRLVAGVRGVRVPAVVLALRAPAIRRGLRRQPDDASSAGARDRQHVRRARDDGMAARAASDRQMDARGHAAHASRYTNPGVCDRYRRAGDGSRRRAATTVADYPSGAGGADRRGAAGQRRARARPLARSRQPEAAGHACCPGSAVRERRRSRHRASVGGRLRAARRSLRSATAAARVVRWRRRSSRLRG